MVSTFALPTSQGATFTVRAFNVCPPSVSTRLPTRYFVQPALEGREIFSPPVFAFLLQHNKSGKRYLFDLGVRKDPENLAPPIAAIFSKGLMSFPVPKDIKELLTEQAVLLDSIDSVILSHSHFDHIGDMSLFPSSVRLVIGEGTDTSGYPTNPGGKVLDSDFADREIDIVSFSEPLTMNIGPYKAVDLFKDSSLFLLDTPGHCAGNMSAMVRVTDTSFVLLGGDTCHSPGQLRPTTALHKSFPCPGSLLALARETISGAHFEPVNTDGKFDLQKREVPLLEAPNSGIHEDIEEARHSIAKLTVLDAHPDVFVVLGHDETLVPLLSPMDQKGDLPEQGLDLKDWQAQGWKEKFIWSFVEPRNASLYSPANE